MPTSEPVAAPSWSLLATRAECGLHGVAAAIDLDRPLDGIVTVTCDPARGDRLLGLDLRGAGRRSEQWTRGRDITVVYETDDARRLRATAMWRLAPEAAGSAARHTVACWELVLSAQTSLLASDSSVAVVSNIHATEVAWFDSRAERFTPEPAARADANGVIARRDDGTSVMVVVHPDDFQRTSVERHDGRIRISCWLFSEQVEKGVLLRSRVLAAIGPTTDQSDWAVSLAHAFSASAPILTT